MNRRPVGTRDERLDVFRGLTMLIIFVAHVPANPWNDWIPARFGFSSGTELFVFCSGIASALAFGGVFVKRGLFLGGARIAYRAWQVYWAHLGLLIAALALAAASGTLTRDFPPFAAEPARALLHAVTLTWLPDYLDILPMYLVILGLVPAVMALRKLHPAAPFLFVGALHGLVWTAGINLPGNPWTGAGWFLNPFAWQLVFFVGFFLGMGWIPVPPWRDPRLLIPGAILVAFAVPLSFWGILETVPAAQALRDLLLPASEKSNAHLLRLLHFLALAYLVLSVIEPYRAHIAQGIGALLIRIGRQSLAAFLASLMLARLAGLVLDAIGRDAVAVTAVNFAGMAALLAIAMFVGWFKSAPWAGSPPDTNS